MNTNLKVVLSAVAFAALVTAPAVAKSRPRHDTAPAEVHSKFTVIQAQGYRRVLGADPDPQVRLEMRRDGNSSWESGRGTRKGRTE